MIVLIQIIKWMPPYLDNKALPIPTLLYPIKVFRLFYYFLNFIENKCLSDAIWDLKREKKTLLRCKPWENFPVSVLFQNDLVVFKYSIYSIYFKYLYTYYKQDKNKENLKECFSQKCKIVIIPSPLSHFYKLVLINILD